MMRNLLAVGVLLARGVVLAADVAPASSALTAVECTTTQTGVMVSVQSSVKPEFTVFRLNGPDRLVVDVLNGSVTPILGHHQCQAGSPISDILATQFRDGRSEVGRLLIGLDGSVKYDIRVEGTRLNISVDRTSHDGVLRSKLDEIVVGQPATKLERLRYSSGKLELVTDGPIAKFEVLELSNPARLAIDVFGVRNGARTPRISDSILRDVRLGSYADRTRIVLEATQALPSYSTVRTAHGVEVLLHKAAPTPPEPQAASEPSELEIDGQKLDLGTSSAKPADLKNSLVSQVRFRETAAGGHIEIKANGKVAFRVTRPDSKNAVLTLENATLAPHLERSLDTSDLETPVRMVSTFAVPGEGRRVRIVVAASEPIVDTVNQNSTGLTWHIAQGSAAVTLSEAKVSGFQAEAESVAETTAPEARRYVGRRVSFEFKDIDMHNLLRIISEISKKNIIVSDEVSGKVTLRLRNVPWDQVLELVLRAKDLGKEEFGNIIRVAPNKTLEGEAVARAAKAESIEKAAPLQVLLLPVNYSVAADMAPRVKDVLTKRGAVSIDARTNTLIIREVSTNLSRVRSLVTALDTQTPQVLIESRIVEANTSFSREVGIQWGGQGNLSPSSGNPTGLSFPNTVSVAGGVPGGANAGTAAAPNYAVNFPVGVTAISGGSLGMIFGSAGGAAQLNLRLTALEAQGAVKTISAPKVATLDNETARISQGLSLPFGQVSAAGASILFIEARLQLEVTPHITQDGSVLMKVFAQNNQPDPANVGFNNQPGIQRKEASTNVLVKDGDTTVLGGIYVRRGSLSQNRIPILSQIPILGFFFRNQVEREDKQELLIFISPRILNRQVMQQSL